MFPGYDPEKKPPYTQDVYEVIKGVTYLVRYTVSNGYGGSISISSTTCRVVEEGLADEEKNSNRE